jgi:hypothetical protein
MTFMPVLDMPTCLAATHDWPGFRRRDGCELDQIFQRPIALAGVDDGLQVRGLW